MKVKDLIESLSHYDPNYDVVIQYEFYIDPEHGYINKYEPIFYTCQDPNDKMVYIGG